MYVGEVEDGRFDTGRVDDLDRGEPVVADKPERCRLGVVAVVVTVDRCPRVRVGAFVAIVVDVLGNGDLDDPDDQGALGRSPVLMFGWRGAGKTDDAFVGTRSDQTCPPLNSKA